MGEEAGVVDAVVGFHVDHDPVPWAETEVDDRGERR
jgi:hypothetical protein